MIEFLTFGLKHHRQERPKADFYVDCRFLSNPPKKLWDFSGRDPRVAAFIAASAAASASKQKYMDVVSNGVSRLIEAHQNKSLRVAFFCIGGKHRSVFMAERLASIFKTNNVDVSVHHVDVNKSH